MKIPDKTWDQVQKNVCSMRKKIHTDAETFGKIRKGTYVEVDYRKLEQILDFITNAKKTLTTIVKVQKLLGV